jgi:hypothetical protein
MKRFVEGTDREQSTLFPECLEDWIDEDNPVRVIDAFVEELDLGELGFDGVAPEDAGWAGVVQEAMTSLRHFFTALMTIISQGDSKPFCPSYLPSSRSTSCHASARAAASSAASI